MSSTEIVKQLTVAAIYALISWLVHINFAPTGEAVIFFIPSGIALAALLIGGPRYFWAVFAGALLANLIVVNAFWAGVVAALGAALAALGSALLIKRWGSFDARLNNVRDLIQLGLGGFAGSTVSAVVGVASLQLTRVASSDAFWLNAITWWQGDVLGVVLLTPLILVWWPNASNPVKHPSIKELGEAALIFGLTVLAGGIVFLDWWHQWESARLHFWFASIGNGYWMFLYIAWSAVRLGARATSLALLLVALLGITGVYQGVGFFGIGQVAYQLSNYWFFTLILSFVGMALAVLIDAGKNNTKWLRQSKEVLNQELINVLAAVDQHSIVSVTDVQGRITLVNDKLCEISGYSREELLGQNHRLLNSDLHPKEFFLGLYQTISAGHVWHGEMRNRAKDGRFYWIKTSITPFMGDNGKPEKYVAIRTDITPRKVAEYELQLHRDHLKELVQQKTIDLQQSVELYKHALAELKQQKFVLDQHASVTITDVAGRITYANDLFSQISGFSREDVMGKDHHLLNSGYHPQGFFKTMYDTISRGEVWHAEVCNRAKDGHLYWVDMTAAAFMDDDGKPQSYIGVRTDITARKRGEEAALAANQAKSDFLANMSHEIRTPMNGVVGMVDILQETQMTPEQHRMLGTIHKSSLALLTILNDILDLSKIEAGKLSIESLPTPLREISEEVAQLMSTSSSSKAVELYLFVAPELPRWVMMDPTRLRQILLNLLGNAVKFSMQKEGQIAQAILSVTPCTLAGNLPGVRFSVQDNGIGISPQALSMLFQPFTQADESTARKFGGTGLGLSITQRLVKLMGGGITVRSTLGAGSEFMVELPLLEAAQGRMTIFDPRLDGVQVLAVTRDAFTAQLVHAYCTSAGAQVTVAADLASAQAQLSSLAAQPACGPTVLLLDRDTPYADDHPAGVGLVRLTHQNSTANGSEITVFALPLLFLDLIRSIAIASSRLIAPDTDTPQPEPRSTPRFKAPSVEEAQRTGRLILLAEDNETNREVLQEQLRLLGYASESAEDGLLALAKWRTGRFALLLTDCHMPNMDGFGLTEAIRQAEPEGQHFPIVAVTANALQGQAERCHERGMDDYLSKPLRLNELGSMLSKWLPLVHSSAPESAPEAPAEFAASFFAIWDAGTLSQLVGDNPAMHRRLLEKFLSNAEKQMAAIGIAIDQGDFSAVVDVAHPLKSASRSVGALLLGELCEVLEDAGNAQDMPTCKLLAERLSPAFTASVNAIRHHLLL